ncbi:3-hydroxyacyl-CoA dehydrogenase family protein [uncultured Umboniibacter sp.]|uniref:3-hydroxyacyl-CoA dehydrogenase family protein n=1 Tax=uncultured Umboniibacter sp. TaxID=1798917 RepID=UPI0026340C08|nr:3-hydroxyacyl-CoA dehydrogenase family protein [uncultured Umboniibacter sp.]
MQTQSMELETRISSKDIQNIAVLGQGIMGVDIAITFALAGYKVTAVDVSEQQIEIAEHRTKASLKLMIESGLVEEDCAQKAQQLIVRTIEWDGALANADFVMEVVPENIAQKKAVFEQCDKICAPDVIIASNTSSMSISHISQGMDYPQRAITAHWTIPAHLSPLVEVVPGIQTAKGTELKTMDLLNKIGKHPVRCKDTPGFIHNILQGALINAAMGLMDLGVATADEIDSVVKSGFGLRLPSVGPIQFMDMVGLDSIVNVGDYLAETMNDPSWRSHRRIRDKVSQGDLGVKTGKGFYQYANANADEFWEEINGDIIKTLKARL